MRQYSRREFISQMAALASGACCLAALGPLGSRYAYGQSGGGSGKAAVFLNQFGGCDPLNSFSIPYTLASYYDRRPTIAIAEPNVLKLNGTNIGVHPVLLNLQRMFNNGEVAIIRGAGDPAGTRSHFTSQDIFSRGTTETVPSDSRGWIGRLGDLYFDSVELNTLALGVGSKIDMISNRTSNTPLSVSSLSSVGYRDPRVSGIHSTMERALKKETLANMNDASAGGGSAIRDIVDNSRTVFTGAISDIADARNNYNPDATYANTGVGRYLSQVATISAYGLGTKVFYGGIGGWDNHSNQGADSGSQANLLAQIDNAIGAFETDMKTKNLWDKVTICIFTEFGRKTFENGSGGTDHGWGSSMVMIGGDVQGGVYGAETTEADMTDRSWLYQDVDFRNPFSEIISWLGYNPDPVFTQNYTKQNLGLI